MRALATACISAGRGVPPVHAIVVELDAVRFRLAAPDEHPPTGFSADDDGRTWRAPLPWLKNAEVAQSVPAPYPRLVSLGNDGDGFVLVNLGHTGGIVSLEGDAAQVLALAEAWTRELAMSPWSRGVQVVRVGIGPDIIRPIAGLVEARTVADVGTALADEGGGVLLLGSVPGGRDGERVRSLADDPAGHWSVVVLGYVEDARWRFALDPTGRIDTGILGGPAVRRLDPSADVSVRVDAPAGPAGQLYERTARKRAQLGSRLAASPAILGLVAFIGLLAVGVVVAVPAVARQLTHTAMWRPATSSSQPPTGQPPTNPVGNQPPGTGVIRSVLTGLCVDSDTNPAVAINGNPSGGHAFARMCNGAGSQQWLELAPPSPANGPAGGMSRLVNRQTGLCLENSGLGIYTLPCLDGDPYQVWQRVDLNTVAAAYRDQATNLCLSVTKPDGALQTRPCPTNGSWPNDLLFRRPP